MPAERKEQPPCYHEREFGEGVEWPNDASLNHFDNCLTPEGRQFVWDGARQMADRGSRCLLEDHRGRIDHLTRDARTGANCRIAGHLQIIAADQAYIQSVTAQLHVLVMECKNQDGRYQTARDAYLDMAERLTRVLGDTRVEIETKLQ